MAKANAVHDSIGLTNTAGNTALLLRRTLCGKLIFIMRSSNAFSRADKAFDADWLLYYLESESIEAVIPPKSSRLQKRAINYKSYKQRNVIKRTINKPKHYRKSATRYEKTAAFFKAICCVTGYYPLTSTPDVNMA